MPWEDVELVTASEWLYLPVELDIDNSYTFSVRAVDTDGTVGPARSLGSFDLFRPDSISGLQLWFDASHGLYTDRDCSVAVADGDAARCWNSRVGDWNAYGLRDLSGPTPIELFPMYTASSSTSGHPSMTFSGGKVMSVYQDIAITGDTNLVIPNLSGASGVTVITADHLLGSISDTAVHYPINSENLYEIAYGRNGFQSAVWGDQQWQWYISTGPWASSEDMVSTLRYDGVTHEHFHNGVSQGTQISASSGPMMGNINGDDEVFLGGRSYDGAPIVKYDAKQYEVMVFDTALTDAQLADVHRYLLEKLDL
jgi:hypothetical protein